MKVDVVHLVDDVPRVVNTASSIVEYPLDLAAAPTALLAHITMLGHQAWAARSSDPRRHAET